MQCLNISRDSLWFGDCRGIRGWFPRECVQMLAQTVSRIEPGSVSPTGPGTVRSSPVLPNKTLPNYVSPLRRSGEVTGNSARYMLPVPPAHMPGSDASPSLQPDICFVTNLLARARSSNSTTETDQLAYSEGDVVEVLTKPSDPADDWWFGKLHGRSGWFSSNNFDLFSSVPAGPRRSTSSPYSRRRRVLPVSAAVSAPSQSAVLQMPPLPPSPPVYQRLRSQKQAQTSPTPTLQRLSIARQEHDKQQRQVQWAEHHRHLQEQEHGEQLERQRLVEQSSLRQRSAAHHPNSASPYLYSYRDIVPVKTVSTGHIYARSSDDSTDIPASSAPSTAVAAAVPLQARALTAYRAKTPGELSFQTNDLITLLEVSDDGQWWRGQLNDWTGWLPSSLVHVLEPKAKIDPAGLVIALYDFVGTTSVELTLREGDRVRLIPFEPESNDMLGHASEWLLGRTETGQTGWFPRAYVAPFAESFGRGSASPRAFTPSVAHAFEIELGTDEIFQGPRAAEQPKMEASAAMSNSGNSAESEPVLASKQPTWGLLHTAAQTIPPSRNTPKLHGSATVLSQQLQDVKTHIATQTTTGAKPGADASPPRTSAVSTSPINAVALPSLPVELTPNDNDEPWKARLKAALQRQNHYKGGGDSGKQPRQRSTAGSEQAANDGVAVSISQRITTPHEQLERAPYPFHRAGRISPLPVNPFAQSTSNSSLRPAASESVHHSSDAKPHRRAPLPPSPSPSAFSLFATSIVDSPVALSRNAPIFTRSPISASSNTGSASTLSESARRVRFTGDFSL
eukprot:TRINITY_DN3590_c0_g1_i1.p1 TRINITY_DN3590_c0_g1~~TRINITY_DN3590_c0_g1_i1.p1  ORF type:complete len:792 (-),score=101.13 TRINITY_DN3590_c0_g1_i1:62-2437(-)